MYGFVMFMLLCLFYHRFFLCLCVMSFTACFIAVEAVANGVFLENILELILFFQPYTSIKLLV